MKTIKVGNTQLSLYADEIFKEFDKKELLNRKKAGLFLTRRLRKAVSGKGVSSPGGLPSQFTGNLKRSMGIKVTKDREVMVGSKKGKGSHAHLVEFGHEPDKEQTKRPYFKKTFDKNKEVIKDMLNESWE